MEFLTCRDQRVVSSLETQSKFSLYCRYYSGLHPFRWFRKESSSEQNTRRGDPNSIRASQKNICSHTNETTTLSSYLAFSFASARFFRNVSSLSSFCFFGTPWLTFSFSVSCICECFTFSSKSPSSYSMSYANRDA